MSIKWLFLTIACHQVPAEALNTHIEAQQHMEPVMDWHEGLVRNDLGDLQALTVMNQLGKCQKKLLVLHLATFHSLKVLCVIILMLKPRPHLYDQKYSKIR